MGRIERKIPRINTEFERDYEGIKYKLKVVATSEGLRYELNGHLYKTPTAAAKTITKYEVNGWRFWHMKKE